MGKPAARITDMHTCPMVNPGPVPHVGGPIAKGSTNVLIGNLPAARVGDMAICVGPPDTVASGSSGVMINGLPAARMGDSTAHGGKIVVGMPTVLIGGGGGGGGSTGGSTDTTVKSSVLAGNEVGLTASLSDLFLDKGTSSSSTPASGPKWTEEGIKKELGKTTAGKKILKNLPSSTKFKSYKRKPGDNRNAYYNRKENVVYIPEEYTSEQAAPTAGHEAVHADQVVNHKRPKDGNDLVEMEVEAKNAGLNVYEQMGRPDLPYDYKSEADFRKKDPAAYDALVRKTYKKHYGIK